MARPTEREGEKLVNKSLSLASDHIDLIEAFQTDGQSFSYAARELLDELVKLREIKTISDLELILGFIKKLQRRDSQQLTLDQASPAL